MHWLPKVENWSERLRGAAVEGGDAAILAGLANTRLGYVETLQLDRLAGKHPPDFAGPALRLAVLGSSTVDHLLPAIRVGGLRRRLRIETYVAPYGQYNQEVADPESGLARFAPDAVLLALDARHMLGGKTDGLALEEAVERCRNLWREIAERFGAAIIQQTLPPVLPRLAGHNEQRLTESAAWLTERFNHRLRQEADEAGADLLALDQLVARDGIDAWHDPVLWNEAKQEIRPAISPLYGDHVARLLAAQRGLSGKCLALDLDNTLWGGVIGDDGLEGIRLGQGSGLGEAFVHFQTYVRDLSRRGVILAVVSKNDDKTAQLPFDSHPEMVLKRADIACFVANWADKPANLREIARILNIGLDSIVFVDDNPFERELVRRELPMVMVPELPEDPALYVRCLADAGYFEATRITEEDRERGGQYQANAARDSLRAEVGDIGAYLAELSMEMKAQPFDPVGLSRIAQLINKTNQFNLCTRRYAEEEVRRLLSDRSALTLQIRLSDRFGDNGIIGAVIGRMTGSREIDIETWLMSCRVLGRKVEEATLNIVVEKARRMGAEALIGHYRPTARNGMVREHYAKLGFTQIDEIDGATAWRLDLKDFVPAEVPIHLATEREAAE